MPIDPSFAISGPEWQIGGTSPNAQTPPAAGGGFGSMLSNSIQSLTDSQNEAAGAAQAQARLGAGHVLFEGFLHGERALGGKEEERFSGPGWRSLARRRPSVSAGRCR